MIAIWILPEKLTLKWNKKSVGIQMTTCVDSLLGPGNALQCKIYLLSVIQILKAC